MVKIVTDYEAQREVWGERFVYEEMKQTCYEMESGIMESESYERFGRRCERQEYIRLGALLSQNLRKGGKGLVGESPYWWAPGENLPVGLACLTQMIHKLIGFLGKASNAVPGRQAGNRKQNSALSLHNLLSPELLTCFFS